MDPDDRAIPSATDAVTDAVAEDRERPDACLITGYHPSDTSVPATKAREQALVGEVGVPPRHGSHPGDRYVRVTRRESELAPTGEHPHPHPTALPRPVAAPHRPTATKPLVRWLLQGQVAEPDAPYQQEREATHHAQSWWKVMCLTGVDYFSTLGYQPGIAALAAGALAPFATLILVLLTLLGALPIYRRVARESPHGEGSIAMLERLLPWWQGKLFVLALLGFVATDFIITITLSAADAAAHVVENPFVPAALHGQEIAITLGLVVLLGAVFLKGFKEAVGIAVVLVGLYLTLNAVVIVAGLREVLAHPSLLGDWRTALFAQHSNPLAMLGVSLLLFPKLALGLSGFETGVAVMPLVKGDAAETEANPVGRVRNTQRLLLVAAAIMSVFLLTSSFVTTLVIPHREFEAGGKASGRALAFLAHRYFGDIFGTFYDISTIAILWFAGASALAGLLNIVPRYLPRYGMAPEWTRAARPLVLVFMAIAFTVTITFKADVEAQGGAYATGVLVLMSSAAVAVTIAAYRAGQRAFAGAFGLIALVFVYTTTVNVVERPDGIKIASFFIGTIIVTSLVSRVWRSTELRVTEVVVDEVARGFIEAAAAGDGIHVIANHPDERNVREYLLKDREQRADNNIPHGASVLFLEVGVRDASEFAPTLHVRGENVGGYRVLRAEGASVPNSIAAFLLWLRDTTGKPPHVYFGWTEGNPLKFLARYVLFGEGDIAPVTHEVLRKAERDPARRPAVHVG